MPVPQPNEENFYQSPPGSGANDGALPSVWVPNWPVFINLTSQQITAFMAFPQDLSNYARIRRWQAENTVLPVTVTLLGVPTVLQIDMTDRGQARVDKLARKWAANAVAVTAFLDTTGKVFQLNSAALMAIDTAVTNMVENLFTALNTLLTGINAAPPTITTRKQIDAAIAVVAPNSPSAINPSPV